MVNYAYPLPLLIFSNFVDATYFRRSGSKMATYETDRIFAVKSQFSSEIGYLYNFSVVSNTIVSNAYHF